MKRACSVVVSVHDQKVVPGWRDAVWAHRCGKATPQGSIRAARPYIQTVGLNRSAGLLLEGRDQKLNAWAFDLNSYDG